VGKGIRQNRFVTLGKELALKNGYMGEEFAFIKFLKAGIVKYFYFFKLLNK
jgi:hypothetical protein